MSINLIENKENTNNETQEITIKIRTMDKEFEIKINRTLTIRALKEKIQEVNLISHLLYNY
jgi:hypothetical protein